MNNLTLRILTALVGVIVIVGSLFLHQGVFITVFALIAVLTHIEYIRTTSLSPKLKTTEFIFPLACNLIIIGFFQMRFIEHAFLLRFLFASTIILVIVALTIELYQKREAPFHHVGVLVLGLLYIPVSFGWYIQTTNSQSTAWFSLGILCMVWCNDTFAYFAGRWLGKHKLFERISPKKTWEGFIGGMCMTIACGFVLSHYYINLSAIEWMGLGLVVSIAGTYGDLVESLLKRSTQLKDSGSLLPGHGGFLDRFDGFLFAVPAAIAYLAGLNII